MAVLFDNGIFNVEGANGAVLPGAKLNWYTTGTSTRLNTYTTSALSVANANPVVADANGRFGPMWLSDLSTAKFVLTDANDNIIVTRDPAGGAGTDLSAIQADLDAAEADIVRLEAQPLSNISYSALQFLRRAIANKKHTATAVKIVFVGNSNMNSAGISNSANNPGTLLVTALKAALDPKNLCTWTTVNRAVDGTTYSDSMVGTTNGDALRALVTADAPDLVVALYGTNDGRPEQYNSGQAENNVQRYISSWNEFCRSLNADAVHFTVPHLATSRVTYTINQTIPVTYPTGSWTFTETYTFTQATKRITATTAGLFASSTWGFGMAAGKKINITSGAWAGTYTIASIDGTGNFLTVTEAVPADTSYSTTVQRVAIDSVNELVPSTADSTFLFSPLGITPQITLDTRFWEINKDIRIACESGIAPAPVIDLEYYYLRALQARNNVETAYYTAAGSSEIVHWNDLLATEVIDPAVKDFARALQGSFGGRGMFELPRFLRKIVTRPIATFNSLFAAGTPATSLNPVPIGSVDAMAEAGANSLVARSKLGVYTDRWDENGVRRESFLESIGGLSRIEAYPLKGHQIQGGAAVDIDVAIPTDHGFIGEVAFWRGGGIDWTMLHIAGNNVGGTVALTSTTLHEAGAAAGSVAGSTSNVRLTPSGANATAIWGIRVFPKVATAV